MAQEALAFDMYGTLVNPLRIWQQLEQYVGPHAQRAAELWRQKQLEYTFRLTAMERYEDFEQVTRKALDYALLATKASLSAGQKQHLMEQYNALEAFPDVQQGLQRLQQAGHVMVVFSNGTPTMLAPLLHHTGLERYMQDVVAQGYISVDEIQIYKPAPSVYQLVANRLHRPIHEARLISSNPFDIIGASSAGMQATWIDRSGGLFDTLDKQPEMVVRSLLELADRLGA